MLLIRHSRRSTVLTLLGVIYIMAGWSYIGINDQIKKIPIAAQSYAGHLLLWNMNVWGCLMIAAGTVGIVSALTVRHTAGFGALMFMGSWFGMMFIVSWLVTGYDRALLGAQSWAGLILMLGVIAGWPDPPKKTITHEFFTGDAV